MRVEYVIWNTRALVPEEWEGQKHQGNEERERQTEGERETERVETGGRRKGPGNEPRQLISLGFHNALANERPL